MKKLFAFIIIVTVIGIIGCDNDSTSPGPGPGGNTNTPKAPTINVTGPETQSTDQYALMAKSYASLVNAQANFAQPYAGLPGTQNGNTWTYTFTHGSFTMTMTATEESNGNITWRLVFDGQDPDDNTVYNDWVAMEGTTNADGSSGSWTIYHENSTVVAAHFMFSTNSSGTVTSDLSVYDETGTLDGRYVVMNNPDGSGEVSLYEGDNIIVRIEWAADGSGEWWTYDSTTGAQTGTGTWS